MQFFVTGRFLLGEGLDFTGAYYGAFSQTVLDGLAADGGFWQHVIDGLNLIFGKLGLDLIVGCIPWSIVSAWTGYHLSLRFVRRLQSLRRRRQQERFAMARP